MKTLVSAFYNNNINAKKIPVWFMRQAGRYLPEYLELRKDFSSFIDFCLNSKAAVKVTLQPIERFDIDAAIIFSDILIIPFALGLNVVFEPNLGPKLPKLGIDYNLADLNLSSNRYTETFSKVMETVGSLKSEIDSRFPDKTLIGFSGSPWTVACYMIQGSNNKDFFEARALAYSDPNSMQNLIDILVESTIEYLSQQIINGAEVIKLFDSWAGLLSKKLFLQFVIEPTKIIVSELKKKFPHVPIIGFPRGAGIMYKQYLIDTGVDCVAIDHTIPLEWAATELQPYGAVQGNLDNIILTTSNKDLILTEVNNIVETLFINSPNRKFIFNLGHGCLPQTNIESLEMVISLLRSYNDYGNVKR